MRNPFSISLIFAVATIGTMGLSNCKKDPEPPTRSFRMGFAPSAPRFDDFNLAVQAIQMTEGLEDAAIISDEVPWDSLLAGVDPVGYVHRNQIGLVDYYRQHQYQLWVYIDPANGLNRASDANALVAKGKSIAQEEVQTIYRRYVFVMDSMLHPEHLGLALETNLIRLSSSNAIYDGIKAATHAAAIDIRQFDSSVKLSVSIQADVAWGKLQGTNVYQGVAQDVIDFPFVEEIGISSYPYFFAKNPSELPDDYYSKIATEISLPVFISEGGWSSQSFAGPNNTTIDGSPEMQAAYIDRQAVMLNNANGVALFQLTFTDIDINALPTTVDPTIKYFAYLGLLDASLKPRPSLDNWKAIFQRPIR